MHLTHVLITCSLLISTLLISQVQAIPKIPGGIIDGSFMFSKQHSIATNDIIVNVGKVEVEIEKGNEDYPKVLGLADTTSSTSIEANDIIINVGKVEVEIEKDDHHDEYYPPHSTKPIIGKPSKPIKVTTDPIPSTPTVEENITLPLFEDFTPAAEPDADEVVLGENATAAITVQGGEQFDERGVLILTGPQIFSVTFKIIREKVITIKGSNLKDGFGIAGIDEFESGFEDEFVDEFGRNRKRREAVTFIFRGRGFVPGREFFTDIEDVVGGTSRGGMFEFLEPRVFLGAIPLKVVRFTDTVILARFLDFEDQRRFEAGTLLARVKVLHVDIRRKEKKHGFEDDFGVLAGPFEKERTEIVSVGGLVLPALGAIGGSITSGPVLGVVDGVGIGVDRREHEKENRGFESSLLGLFSGLRFDTAVLAVQFSEKDAQKIRGSFNTLFTDDIGLGFPDI